MSSSRAKGLNWSSYYPTWFFLLLYIHSLDTNNANTKYGITRLEASIIYVVCTGEVTRNSINCHIIFAIKHLRRLCEKLEIFYRHLLPASEIKMKRKYESIMFWIRFLAVTQYDAITGSIGAEWEQWLPEIKADHSVRDVNDPLRYWWFRLGTNVAVTDAKF